MSLHSTSRTIPPTTPVITPIITAMKRGISASSAIAVPEMLKIPAPIASATSSNRSADSRDSIRSTNGANSASTKIAIT